MKILQWLAEQAAQCIEQEIAQEIAKELAKWPDKGREGRLMESIDPSIPIEETVARHPPIFETLRVPRRTG